VTPADGLPTRTALISGLCSAFSCSASADGGAGLREIEKDAIRIGDALAGERHFAGQFHRHAVALGHGVRVIDRTIAVC
jgi:hypothetical protein